jgi:uncharacterized membrane-anchored protein
MRLATPPRILIVAALCAVSLIGLVLVEGNARSGGLEARLPMEAVDPRSLLSGHYVQINLTQRLDAGEACPRGGPESKWLALRRDGDIYELAGGAASDDDARQISAVAVRGSFDCSPPVEIPDAEPAPGWVTLHVGIDRFYVNQTEALRIEQALREQRPGDETRAFAIVSIGRDGRARLVGLMVDGERLDLNWL